MSFYNMLFGKNVHSDIILALLGLKKCDIERYRDCGMTQDEIFVYTRTGGGNRDWYPNKKLTESPYYKYDEDDDFDSTYATYYFRYPDEVKEEISCLLDIENKGLPASLIRWITKTLFREPTDADKYASTMEKHKEIFNSLILQGDLTQPWNGHTCVILSDFGAKAVFKMFEEAGFIYYNAAPLMFDVIKNDYKSFWYKEKSGEGQSRIALTSPKNWEIDKEAAERYLNLYAEQFPRAAAYFREKWSSYE